jgi:hypothetical protein
MDRPGYLTSIEAKSAFNFDLRSNVVTYLYTITISIFMGGANLDNDKRSMFY